MFVVATITPYNKEGEIDQDAFGWLLERLEKERVNGLFIAGTTGEWPLLKNNEKLTLFQKAIETLGSNVKVFAGVSAHNPEETFNLVGKVADIGVDYIFSTPPLYYRPSNEFLKKFYLRIAKIAETPVIIYSIPANIGYNVPVDVVRQLAMESSNIVGIKATVDDTLYISELVNKVKKDKKDFMVLSGGEEKLLYTLSVGGDGCVSAIGNLMPKIGLKLLRAWNEGSRQSIVALQKIITNLTIILSQHGPFPSVIKALLSIMGTPIREYVRAPLETIPDAYMLASYLCNNYNDFFLDDIKCTHIS